MNCAPAYFLTPVFLGGPVDGLEWCSLPSDQIRTIVRLRGGIYRLAEYRNCGKEAVYRWEACL